MKKDTNSLLVISVPTHQKSFRITTRSVSSCSIYFRQGYNRKVLWSLSYFLLRLDDLLQGGLYSNQITEIIGLAGAGKTEFCVNVALTSLITTIDHIVYIHSLGQNGLNRLKAKAEVNSKSPFKTIPRA